MARAAIRGARRASGVEQTASSEPGPALLTLPEEALAAEQRQHEPERVLLEEVLYVGQQIRERVDDLPFLVLVDE